MMQPRVVSIAALVVAMVSVQLGASIAKGLFGVLGPEGTTTARTFLAAVILAIIFRPWRGRLTKQAIRLVVIYGTTLGIMNFVFYLSLARIPLGVAVALEFTGPLAVATVASRRPIDALWILLALAGIIMLLPLTSAQATLDPIGVALALAAGVCWALYIIFGQRVGAVMPAGRATALGMVCAAILTLPAGVAHAGTALIDPAVLPLALGVAVLSGALPYSLEMFALKRMPAKTFGILMSLGPAVAAIFGVIVLTENLTPLQWLAIGCVVTASVGSSSVGHRPQVDSLPSSRPATESRHRGAKPRKDAR